MAFATEEALSYDSTFALVRKSNGILHALFPYPCRRLEVWMMVEGVLYLPFGEMDMIEVLR